MKKAPEPAVFSWIGSVPFELLYTTTITQTEILFGILNLPSGKRRDDLAASFQLLMEVDFEGHVLPFDHKAAHHYAEIRSVRKAIGRSIMAVVSMIAGIVSAHDAMLVSRDSVFADCGFDVVNPWGL